MKTKHLVLTSLFSAILCVCTFITIPIPITTIPLTLQVMAVCAAGGILGKKYGTVSVLIYILLGIFGLPVFSGMRGGAAVIAGPTGGYIIGFIPAAFVVGLLIEITENVTDNAIQRLIKYSFSMIVGLIIIYAVGTVQFMFIMKTGLFVSLMQAVIPFIPMDLVKIALAVMLTAFVKRNSGVFNM